VVILVKRISSIFTGCFSLHFSITTLLNILISCDESNIVLWTNQTKINSKWQTEADAERLVYHDFQEEDYLINLSPYELQRESDFYGHSNILTSYNRAIRKEIAPYKISIL